MSTDTVLRRKHHRRIRLCISTLLTLTLASVILWGLMSISEPKAKLNKLTLRKVNDSYSKLYIVMQLTNHNYFRGFNHTAGWVEAFYMSENGTDTWDLQWDYTPVEYQGFGKTLTWNFTLYVTEHKLPWAEYTPLLKNKESHIYVSVYLSYFYNILSWTTEKTYYQWLETNAYLNGSFDLQGGTDFNRTKNFDLAF